MKHLRITLKKSLIGRQPKHVVTAKTLGLRKPNQSVIHRAIPEIQGMINKISYLLTVEEITHAS